MGATRRPLAADALKSRGPFKVVEACIQPHVDPGRPEPAAAPADLMSIPQVTDMVEFRTQTAAVAKPLLHLGGPHGTPA